MKLKLAIISLVLLGLALSGGVGSVLAAAAPVTITSKAVVEIEEINAEGEVVIKRVAATKVLPGTPVIFVNTVTNNGEAPANNIVINNAVPENMVFKKGSATGMDSNVTYSVDDGATFNNPDKLFVPLADGSLRPAGAEDFTNIRWTLTQPMPPAAAGTVEFQAQLK